MALNENIGPSICRKESNYTWEEKFCKIIKDQNPYGSSWSEIWQTNWKQKYTFGRSSVVLTGLDWAKFWKGKYIRFDYDRT